MKPPRCKWIACPAPMVVPRNTFCSKFEGYRETPGSFRWIRRRSTRLKATREWSETYRRYIKREIQGQAFSCTVLNPVSITRYTCTLWTTEEGASQRCWSIYEWLKLSAGRSKETACFWRIWKRHFPRLARKIWSSWSPWQVQVIEYRKIYTLTCFTRHASMDEWKRTRFWIEGAVALILIGIGVIIGLAICRRRTASPLKDGPDDFTTPTYVSAQRIEPRIRYSGDSRRSQRTSLYIEENRNGRLFFDSRKA